MALFMRNNCTERNNKVVKLGISANFQCHLTTPHMESNTSTLIKYEENVYAI